MANNWFDAAVRFVSLHPTTIESMHARRFVDDLSSNIWLIANVFRVGAR